MKEIYKNIMKNIKRTFNRHAISCIISKKKNKLKN